MHFLKSTLLITAMITLMTSKFANWLMQDFELLRLEEKTWVARCQLEEQLNRFLSGEEIGEVIQQYDNGVSKIRFTDGEQNLVVSVRNNNGKVNLLSYRWQ